MIKGAKRLPKLWLRGETSYWLGGETSFLDMKRGRNIFPIYEMGAKRLSEWWLVGETSFWNKVWVQTVFLKYEHSGETSFLCIGQGRNVFPKYELGVKRLTK